jgi:adenylosuccinate lyase
MRETGRSENDLFARLAADERLGLSRAELDDLVTAPLELTGTAGHQIEVITTQIEALAAAHPEAAAYVPGEVL